MPKRFENAELKPKSIKRQYICNGFAKCSNNVLYVFIRHPGCDLMYEG